MSCMITARFLQKTVLVLLDNQWDHRPIGRYPGTVLYGWWWLRSPGNNQNNAANVNNDGSLNNNNVNNDNGCVRPASPCLPEVRPCERRPVPWGRRNTAPFRRDSHAAVEHDRLHALGKICRRRPGRRVKQTAFRTYAFGMCSPIKRLHIPRAAH